MGGGAGYLSKQVISSGILYSDVQSSKFNTKVTRRIVGKNKCCCILDVTMEKEPCVFDRGLMGFNMCGKGEKTQLLGPW